MDIKILSNTVGYFCHEKGERGRAAFKGKYWYKQVLFLFSIGAVLSFFSDFRNDIVERGIKQKVAISAVKEQSR